MFDAPKPKDKLPSVDKKSLSVSSIFNRAVTE
jgi:hypothetical protein